VSFLSKIFDVKKGEGRPCLILFIHFFCFSAMGITAGSARDAFFLSQFEKTFLPLMFVAIAIVMAGVIPFYTKITRGKDLTTVIMFSALIFAGSLIPFTFLLQDWLIPVLYIWVEIIIVLSIIQFWILSGEVFDARQAKRLFGLISGSGAIASMVIGSSISPFVQAFGSDKLLLATSFFIGATAVTSTMIRPHRMLLDSGPAKSTAKHKEKSKIKFDGYLVALTIVICSMAFVSKYVDYQFKIIASNTYQTQDELVSFFGMFYAVTGAAAFIVQFFLTGRILSRFGVLIGMLILPLALFAGSIGFLMIPVLAAIFIPKFADQVFKFTVNNTTVQLLWLPIPPKTKKEKKPVIDGTIKAFIEGFAGLSIFIVAKWVPLNFLSIAVLIVAGVWIVYTFKIKTGYVAALQKAIEKRQLNFEELEVDVADSAMVATIEKALRAEEEVKQLFALELIEDISLSPWAKTLNELFHGENHEVSKTILKLSADNSKVVSDDELMEALQNHDFADIAINIAGIRKLASAVPIVEAYLLDEDPELQITAAAALQFMESEKTEEARELIQWKMSSKDPKIQAMAIKHLSDQNNILTHNLLLKFLKDPSEITSNSALVVAAKRKNDELIPAIITNLDNPKTLPTARDTLQQFSEETVISELMTVLADEKIDQNLLRGIVVTSKVFRSDEMIDALIGLLERNDKRVISDIIDTLLSMARQDPLAEEYADRLKLEVKKISKHTYRLIDFLNSVEHVDKEHTLNEVIQHELSKQVPNLLKLGIIDTPATPVESYLQTIKKQDQRQMPFVLEVLDNIFEREEKELITPFVEGLTTEELSKIGEKHFNEIPISLEKHLSIMISGDKEWASAVATDFTLKHNRTNVLKNIDWDKIVGSLALKEIISKYDDIVRDNDQLQKFKLNKEELAMYSTLEKTILLKTVNLFQTIPTEDLSKVAQIAEEEQFNANIPLFAEGDFGDSLYIIVDGDIKIHKGDRHIALLGKGACLGEMALLDQEPRSADATSETDATLLKITQEDFYEIMSSNMEIMQGIVKLLTGRLRDAIN